MNRYQGALRETERAVARALRAQQASLDAALERSIRHDTRASPRHDSTS